MQRLILLSTVRAHNTPGLPLSVVDAAGQGVLTQSTPPAGTRHTAAPVELTRQSEAYKHCRLMYSEAGLCSGAQ